MVLNWDGSCIGEIQLDKKITKIKLINFDDDGEILKVYIRPFNLEDKYRSIIADELKVLFGIIKIGTHKCTINGNKYIIYKYHESATKLPDYEKNLNEIIGETLLYNIRKCFVFKIILGFCLNLEKTILIIPIDEQVTLATTIKDFKTDYRNIETYNGSTISKKIISKWFDGDWKIIFKIVQSTFYSHEYKVKEENIDEDEINYNKLFDKIDEIIKRIDPTETFWAVEIIDRIKHFFMKF